MANLHYPSLVTAVPVSLIWLFGHFDLFSIKREKLISVLMYGMVAESYPEKSSRFERVEG